MHRFAVERQLRVRNSYPFSSDFSVNLLLCKIDIMHCPIAFRFRNNCILKTTSRINYIVVVAKATEAGDTIERL
jgi:hypothetical protein